MLKVTLNHKTLLDYLTDNVTSHVM